MELINGSADLFLTEMVFVKTEVFEKKKRKKSSSQVSIPQAYIDEIKF